MRHKSLLFLIVVFITLNVWFVKLGILMDSLAARQYDSLSTKKNKPFPNF